jgi:hypothetical protein
MNKIGITQDMVALIIRYGRWNRAQSDREIYWIPDSPFLQVAAPQLISVRNIAVVLAEGNTVVTVYPLDDRFREGYLK